MFQDNFRWFGVKEQVGYLGSGLVKGIGPILAKKLVGRFGAEVLAVIENRAAVAGAT